MSATAKKNLGWLWYFIILGALSILATLVLIVYNNNQQFRPDQLAAARERWREKAPRNYHLVYDIKAKDDAGEERTNHYDVTVSNGVVTHVIVNRRTERPERFLDYGMEKLFDLLAENLEIDQRPDRPRTFTRAMFEPNTGALLWYVRRIMGSRQRLEISFETLE